MTKDQEARFLFDVFQNKSGEALSLMKQSGSLSKNLGLFFPSTQLQELAEIAEVVKKMGW